MDVHLGAYAEHGGPSRRQLLAWFGLTGVAFSVVSCAPAAGPTAGQQPAPATSAPAAGAAPKKGAPSLTKLTVVSTAGILDNVHWMVGKAKGFFEDFGIDFNYLGVQNTIAMVDALLTKSADMVDSSPTTALAAVEKGAGVKILAGSRPRLNYYFFARKSIAALKDLEGKAVGTGGPGSFQHQVSLALFKKLGVDGSKVQFVNIGTSVEVYRAMVAGKVDAGVGGITFFSGADGDGLKVLSEMWKDLPDYLTWSFFTSDEILKEKSDALARVLAGYAKTYRYVRTPESKDLFMKVGVDELKNKPEGVEAYWNFLKNDGAVATNLELTAQQVEYMQQLNVTAGGTQSRVLPFEQIADLSVQKRALELLKS